MMLGPQTQRFRFTPAPGEGILEFRVFFVPATATPSSDASDYMDISAARYLEVAPQDGAVRVSPDAGLPDIEGATVVEGTEYTAAVLTVPVDGSRTPAVAFLIGLLRSPRQAMWRRLLTCQRQPAASTSMTREECMWLILEWPQQGRVPLSIESYRRPARWRSSRRGRACWVPPVMYSLRGAICFSPNLTNSTLSRITPDGTATLYASTGISAPVGLARGIADTTFVANCGDNTVRRVDPDGSTETNFQQRAPQLSKRNNNRA